MFFVAICRLRVFISVVHGRRSTTGRPIIVDPMERHGEDVHNSELQGEGTWTADCEPFFSLINMGSNHTDTGIPS
jgi:hypothetical protein